MSDSYFVDPQGWEYDLQSVYSAYIGYFQLHAVPWHDRTWGQFFETFEQFLAFSWPVITVTDSRTGRAHIVTRMTSVTAFLKMIKTRFGETLPQVDNMLLVNPFETSQRHLRHVNDWSAYKKLHSSLPAVRLAAFKSRVRAGDPNAIRELWTMRDKTFFAIDFESLARNDRVCVEWGYAAIRCSHLEAAGAWPPVPDTNYRKGHYIISEHGDVCNKALPTASWQYAFGESQVISKTKMPRIVQSILSSLVSPDSETVANDVVLVGHGVQAIMQRLEEIKIKLPNNVFVLDVAYLERALFAANERGPMHDRQTGRARLPESLLTLSGLLRSLKIESSCVLHNAGNDAFMSLVAFQRMMTDPRGTGVGVGVSVVGTGTGNGMGKGAGLNGNGNGNGHGHGHVKRAVTIAARLFRPFEGPRPRPDQGTNADRNGNRGGADGMGVNVNLDVKRASVFSTLTSPLPLFLPTDRNKKEKGESTSTSGSGSGGFGNRRVSPPTVVPGQRRHSTMVEKRR